MSAFTAIRAALPGKYWLIYIYVIVSLALTLGMVFYGGIWNAVCLGGTSLLSLIPQEA